MLKLKTQGKEALGKEEVYCFIPANIL